MNKDNKIALLAVGCVFVLLIIFVGGICIYSYVLMPKAVKNIDSLPEVKETVNYSDQSMVWKNLRIKKDNPCEERQDIPIGNAVFELKKYPTLLIGQPSVVSSLRNFVASTFSVDMLDSEGNVIFTVYNVSTYAMDPLKTKVAYIGTPSLNNTDCNSKIFGVYDINNMTNTEVAYSLSDVSENTAPVLDWEDESFFTLSYEEKKSGGLRIEGFDKSTYKTQNTMFLRMEDLQSNSSLRFIKGWYKLNTINVPNYFVEVYNLEDDNNYVYTFDSEYKLIDSKIYSRKSNVKCEPVEYVEGGTSVFCQSI